MVEFFIYLCGTMPTMKQLQSDKETTENAPIGALRHSTGALNHASSSVCNMLDFVCERQMELPLLLLLASHRPLAFVAGQLLLLALPLTLLMPALPLRVWAELLSHPQGPTLLQRRLADAPIHKQAPDEPLS
jgi:hypothetical protein